MRTVYLGTSDFGATVLERVAASPHRPQLVLSRPDRPRGRGRRTQAPPVAERARELGIDVAQPDDLNADATIERIAAARPDALLVCAYGAIIREPLLSAHDAYNVHPSLLPRWRGAAPVERAIQAGDARTGVCIMRPVAELDAGPVHLRATETIHPGDDYGSLAPRLADLGGRLLVQALDQRPEPEPQGQEGVTYAEKIERDERQLDTSRTAAELERTVRALNPHIGTWVADAEDRLGVRRAAVAPEAVAQGELSGTDGRLVLGTADGSLELLEVQPPGKRAMPAADFLRGRG
ncbi:MAG TPA: methionyl-tRNA formyltransferase [Thermoleophilaceae bacterium]|nr:methionyl-tRNA formyltransferase [Thermoleophilaceae bacterium]